MVGRALSLALALLAALMLGGCGAQEREPARTDHFLTLNGSAATLAMGDQRFALAVLAPPAPMLLVRAGPRFFWVTPSLTLREVFVEDQVADGPVDTHVLAVNANGSLDCTYTMQFRS